MANYSFQINPIPAVANGHKFAMDNFLQAEPHTKILEGVTGLQFENCNLTNCDIPADAVTDSCRPKHCEFCSNLHPDWVQHGIDACVTVCSHVVRTDTVTVDGVLVDTVYHYEDKVVS